MTTAKDPGPKKTVSVSRAQAIRDRGRNELRREITAAGRSQLAEVGAAALSMRAIARELGMAPSAVYRYFPSRDALLTELIFNAYQSLADAALKAEKRRSRTDFLGRWVAIFRATRAWALANKHEYSLIYGSPVPGYTAPQLTAEPASQIALCLARIAVESLANSAEPRSGVEDAIERMLRPKDSCPSDGKSALAGPISKKLQSDIDARVEDLVSDKNQDGGLRLPESVMAKAQEPDFVLAIIEAWTQLFGTISFELFGHYRHVIDATGDYFDRLAVQTAASVGISEP